MVIRSRLAPVGWFAALAIGGTGAVACSSVLGFEDLTLDPDASTLPDSSVDTSPDTNVMDTGGERDASVDTGVDVDASVDAQDAPIDVTSEGDAAPDGEAGSDADPDAPDGDGGCGDTQTDDRNCGRCGHDCVGGTCLNGVCQPLTLATPHDGAWGIALGGNRVFATVQLQNWVVMANKTGGGVATQTLCCQPVPIAANDSHFFWATRPSGQGEIYRCPVGGCPGAPESIATPQRPNGIALDATHVYWTDTTAGTISRTDLATLSNTQEIVPSSAGAGPVHLALDAQSVFFTDLPGNRLMRVPLGGGQVDTLANTNSPWHVAVNDSWVVWTAGGGLAGDVNGLPLPASPDAGAPTPLAVGQNVPFGIALDDTHAYWVNRATEFAAEGAIMSCPLSDCGGGIAPVVSNVSYPTDLAIDDEAIYYTVYGLDGVSDGTVMKVAKP